MDQRGAALTICMLADMANLLLKERGGPRFREWAKIGQQTISIDALSLLVDSIASTTITVL
jgi:hypothetical protein